ncbi:GNAT family N-acetyltransferase [Terrabacter aeriphilus]|uniref:GNAT family N-acetyltransferase n=1 Tax=Terrabacter aeriphilus TaxID=515662 RepID=A0ABP9J175_9MICO
MAPGATGPGETRVRVAAVHDAPDVGHLLRDFNEEFDAPGPTAAELTTRFASLLALPDVLVVLAEAAGHPDGVGFALLTLRPTPYYDGPLAQLEELYVRPALRDQGIGTLVLREALRLVAERGAGEVLINVDEVDVDTRRFYERHGFTDVEPGTDSRMLCYLRVL